MLSSLNYVLQMRDAGEDVADIEVKPDGSWRAKAEGDRRGLGELGLWHLPDGTVYPSTEAESKPKVELKSVKQENGSDGHNPLKLGIRKNRNGCWEFNKADNVRGVSSNRHQQNIKNNGENVIPMSSSATGSGRDGEDGSVNQDGGGNFDFCRANGTEYESMPLTGEPPHGFNDPFTAGPGEDAEIIVLSDSDEEDRPLMSSKAVYKSHGADTSGIQFPAPQHGISDSFFENPAGNDGENPCLDPYNTNDDEFGSIWSLPPGGQGVPNFQLFGADADISDTLVGMQHDTLNCQSSMSGYALDPETSMGSGAHIPESDAQHDNTDGGLVDNHLLLSGNDPSLQIFLPTRPIDAATVQTDSRDRPDVSNGSIRSEDWISLRLGDGGGGGRGEPTPANGLGSGNQLQPQDSKLDTLADHGKITAIFFPTSPLPIPQKRVKEE